MKKSVYAIAIAIMAIANIANAQSSALVGQLVSGLPIRGEVIVQTDPNGTGAGKINVLKTGGGTTPTVSDLVIPRGNAYKMAEQPSASNASATIIAQASGLVILTYIKIDENGVRSGPFNVPLRADGSAQLTVTFNCNVAYVFTAKYDTPVVVGPAGPQGPAGPAGPQGTPGVSIQGPAGPQGPAGKNACSTKVIKDYDQAPMGLRTQVQATVSVDCKAYTLYYFAGLTLGGFPGSDGRPHGLAVLIDLATGKGQVDYPFQPHASMMPEMTFDKVVWVPGTTTFEWWKDGLSWGVKWDLSKPVYQIPGFVVFPE